MTVFWRAHKVLLVFVVALVSALSLPSGLARAQEPATAITTSSPSGAIAHFILVISDGLGWEALNEAQPTNIMSMISSGASASHGVCEVPSVTSTNTKTIYTGAHASTHGKVSNWYNHNVYPSTQTIQDTVQTAGLTYEEVTSAEDITDRISGGSLASFTLWWNFKTDHAAHVYGPNSTEYEAEIESVDSSIGQIMQALQATGLSATTVLGLGSDHGEQSLLPDGSTAPDPSRIVDLRATLEGSGFAVDRWLGSGPRVAHVYLTNPSEAAAAKAVLLATRGIDDAFAKTELAGTSLGGDVTAYLDSLNSGDVIAFAAAGYSLGRSVIQSADDRLADNDGQYCWDCGNDYRGGHGGLTSQEMYVPFVLWGDAIIAGANLGPRFDVDWAPTVAAFLGIPAPANSEGSAAVDALRQSVTTEAATNVFGTSATLNAYLNSLGASSSCSVSFEWGTTTSYGNETASQVMTAPGSFTADLHNLSPGTRFHFRAKAVGDGTGYGHPGSFVTTTPNISSVSPNQGTRQQTLNVSITGTCFTGATAVTFSGITVNSYEVNSDTQVTADIYIPSITPGQKNVRVYTPNGTAVLYSGFTVLAAPVISSVSPNQGTRQQTIDVTITATNFTGATAVTISGITVNSFTVNSSTRVTANIYIPNISTGAKNVRVYTPQGTAVLYNGFTVLAAPVISSVSPNQGTQGQTMNVIITGAGFTGATAVTISGITVNSFTVNSATQVAANIYIPAVTPSQKNVRVYTPQVTAVLYGGFTVLRR